MEANQPHPDDISALKEIIDGKPADPLTVGRLVSCNLVEELNGTAVLTDRGIQAAVRLRADATEEKTLDTRRQ